MRGPVHRAVLFVSGCPGDARRYRCLHQLERLLALGVSGDERLHGDVDLEAAVPSYAVFVLHRVPYGPDVEAFLRAAQRAGKSVLFDTDDWVFDLAAATYVAALADMSADDRALYREGLTRYRTTLSRCDGVLVSTAPLVERAAELVPNVHVTPNVASREMVELSRLARTQRALVAERRAGTGEVVLGYFSGTPTHKLDFAEAVPAIASVLDAHPRVRLLLVGHIETPAELRRFGDRDRAPAAGAAGSSCRGSWPTSTSTWRRSSATTCSPSARARSSTSRRRWSACRPWRRRCPTSSA